MIKIPYEQIIERIKNEAKISESEIDGKIKDKMKQLSGLISKEGAAHIVANELGIKLFDAFTGKLQIKNIIAGLRNVETVGKVVQTYELREFTTNERQGKVASMVIGDETGTVRVVMWGNQADNIKNIEKGMTIKILGGYVRDNNGIIELHLNDRSQLILNPEGEIVKNVKQYAAENPEVRYINKPGEALGDFNILDLAFDLNSGALDWANDYFHRAGAGQGIALAINIPYIFANDEYKNSFVRSHIYKAYWLKAASLDETGKVLSLMDMKLDKKKIREIWDESGGLPQLVKYEAVGDRGLIDAVIEPILKVVSRCSPEDLERLSLMENGKIKSKLLAGSVDLSNKDLDIKVAFDLSVTEVGRSTGQKLTQTEANILRMMVTNSGEITKEGVSNIKWGEGKYDALSDRAINKAMRRLSEKLVKHKIITIPKVGYKIVKQDDS